MNTTEKYFEKPYLCIYDVKEVIAMFIKKKNIRRLCTCVGPGYAELNLVGTIESKIYKVVLQYLMGSIITQKEPIIKKFTRVNY